MELPVKGADISETIYLSPEFARSGGPYAHYHRKRDKKLVVKIPAGVGDGKRIRLSGLGQPGRGGAPDGDLYLQVKVKTPLLEKVKKGLGSLIGR